MFFIIDLVLDFHHNQLALTQFYNYSSLHSFFNNILNLINITLTH